MALSDDQKAILRLLAQRGAAGYDDLAALMGISVDEVHARAKQAAADLEAEGIPAPEIPTPGGETGPPSVAKDGEAPPGGPASPEAPKSVAPAEEKNAAPEAKGSPKPKPEPVKPIPHHERGHGPKEIAREAKLLENRGLWAILAGVAIVVLFVVILLVTGSGGGDGNDSSSTTASASQGDCETPTAAAPKPTGKAIAVLAASAIKGGKEPTRAVLNPVDGSEGRGLVVFGRVKNSLALQVAAEGLAPLPSCGGYTVWLAASPTKMLPLASTEVAKNGQIRAQVEVPVEILAYLANETFDQIAITATDESQLKASLAKATKAKKAPEYTGTEVLRGTISGPIVGVAKK
ncbi:MAG TPA: Lrp/AsnC family transcriptional regulator [Solirubrobacterales bacterium]|nr:Lrp/AsnC family transcriptional regulator [Solirubrobacterales bacterium]